MTANLYTLPPRRARRTCQTLQVAPLTRVEAIDRSWGLY